MLAPIHFGLPPKFSSWRSGQVDAVNLTLNADERFVGICAPTGWGKSLGYMAMAMMSGLRTVVLTSTKGLQDQLQADFDTISTDLRGMANYLCPIPHKFGFPRHTVVSEAPCQCGARCHLRSGGCEYFDLYRQAQQADIVVTNYQCWMHDQAKREPLTFSKPVQMLILDEAHDAPEELSGFLGVDLEKVECLTLGVSWPESGYDQAEWRTWGVWWRNNLQERIGRLEQDIQLQTGNNTLMAELRECKKLLRKIERVAGMKEEWVVEEREGGRGQKFMAARFDPLWPKLYSESALFRGIQKVVLVSATVRPKTAELLGLSLTDLKFQEYPSSFPIRSRPVIHVPTVQMNYRNEQSDDKMGVWLRKIDSLIQARQDRKGVVHAVSYNRMRFLKNNSRFADKMMVHGAADRGAVVREFKEAGPGTVLVSPSVDTGYDFPYQECEYQIIGKLPFAPTQGAVMKARLAQDKEYGNYLVAQTLQQMTGRGMRAEDDRCETLILDDNVKWFVGKNKQFLNKWWLEAFRGQEGWKLPEPLPKL